MLYYCHEYNMKNFVKQKIMKILIMITLVLLSHSEINNYYRYRRNIIYLICLLGIQQY